MFCIITQAFKKVKYKFWYSKKSSQKAGSDGPLIWSWNSIINRENLKNILKIKKKLESKNFNFKCIFRQFFQKKLSRSIQNLFSGEK